MNSRKENEMMDQASALELSDEMLVKVVGGYNEHRGGDGHGHQGHDGNWGHDRGHGRNWGHDRGHGRNWRHPHGWLGHII